MYEKSKLLKHQNVDLKFFYPAKTFDSSKMMTLLKVLPQKNVDPQKY